MINTTQNAKLEALKNLSRQTLAEVDKGNISFMESILAPGATFRFSGSPEMDFAQFQKTVGLFFSAFPDLSHQLEAVLAEGETVVRVGTFSGTHRGDFMGIPATGKFIKVPFTAMDTFRNGRLFQMDGRPDMMALMQQLGAIPMPGEAVPALVH